MSRKAVILGFPSGKGAEQSDRFIAKMYRTRNRKIPSWLEEHLANGPVDPVIVENTLAGMEGIEFEYFVNQSLKLGIRLARIESIRGFKFLSSILCKLLPSLCGAILCRYFDHGTVYTRRVYTITRIAHP
ncbi:MAG: hypothetical protein ABIK28_23305 [Planctomycetota bacterium]